MLFHFPTIEWMIQAAIFMDLFLFGLVLFWVSQFLAAWCSKEQALRRSTAWYAYSRKENSEKEATATTK